VVLGMNWLQPLQTSNKHHQTSYNMESPRTAKDRSTKKYLATWWSENETFMGSTGEICPRKRWVESSCPGLCSSGE
jgi:hypothetical protein